MTFVLGFACGVVALLVLIWWLVPDEPPDLFALRARQELADLERRTIHRMLAAEQDEALRRPRPHGSDVIEGSATDLGRRR